MEVAKRYKNISIVSVNSRWNSVEQNIRLITFLLNSHNILFLAGEMFVHQGDIAIG
jgi:hypothetical protein